MPKLASQPANMARSQPEIFTIQSMQNVEINPGRVTVEKQANVRICTPQHPITQPMRKEGKDHLSREYHQVKIEYLNKGTYRGPFHIQTTTAKYFPLYIFHNMSLTSDLVKFKVPQQLKLKLQTMECFPQPSRQNPIFLHNEMRLSFAALITCTPTAPILVPARKQFSLYLFSKMNHSSIHGLFCSFVAKSFHRSLTGNVEKIRQTQILLKSLMYQFSWHAFTAFRHF